MIEPVDPLVRRELDSVDVPPGAAVSDNLGLVKADDRLGERVIVRVSDAVDRGLDSCFGQTLRVAVDNYATHKHAKVKAWLARRPRFHVHFTPTYASWINQVERWFGVITQHAIRRGSFSSVTDLKSKIERYIDYHNQHPQPFVWTATADSILAKIERLCKVINGTSH